MRRSIYVVIAAALLIGAVYGATSVTQQFPSVTVPPNPSGGNVFANCSTLHLSTTPTPVSGFLQFDCGSVAAPAITISSSSTSCPSSCTATPTFTLPAPYNQLNVFAGACTNTSVPSNILASGTAVQFGSGTTWVYCASYNNVAVSGGTLPTFSVTWS